MSDAPVLIIQQQEGAGAGWLAEALDDAGVPYRIVHPYAGEELPDPREWRGIVPLGGMMGAYDTDQYPFLLDEKKLLADATEAGTPVLGICLGSQLLADALGGRAHPAERARLGFPEVELTEEGEADPVLSQVTAPLLVWHGDTFQPPPGASVLAHSGELVYAYRIGSAVAVQFHPEASPELVREWLDAVDDAELERMGIEPGELQAEVDRRAETSRATSRALFRAWLREIEQDRSR